MIYTAYVISSNPQVNLYKIEEVHFSGKQFDLSISLQSKLLFSWTLFFYEEGNPLL